jgi:hypothetical protein
MKTCQASIKQRTPKMGRKRYRMMNDPSLGIKKKPQQKADRKGNMNKSSTQTHLQAHIKYQIRRGEEHMQGHLT